MVKEPENQSHSYCRPSCKRTNWKDLPATKDGVIRTVCKVCGRWIGNRT
jgi:hypothetical protein